MSADIKSLLDAMAEKGLHPEVWTFKYSCVLTDGKLGQVWVKPNGDDYVVQMLHPCSPGQRVQFWVFDDGGVATKKGRSKYKAFQPMYQGIDPDLDADTKLLWQAEHQSAEAEIEMRKRSERDARQDPIWDQLEPIHEAYMKLRGRQARSAFLALCMEKITYGVHA